MTLRSTASTASLALLALTAGCAAPAAHHRLRLALCTTAQDEQRHDVLVQRVVRELGGAVVRRVPPNGYGAGLVEDGPVGWGREAQVDEYSAIVRAPGLDWTRARAKWIASLSLVNDRAPVITPIEGDPDRARVTFGQAAEDYPAVDRAQLRCVDGRYVATQPLIEVRGPDDVKAEVVEQELSLVHRVVVYELEGDLDVRELSRQLAWVSREGRTPDSGGRALTLTGRETTVWVDERDEPLEPETR